MARAARTILAAAALASDLWHVSAWRDESTDARSLHVRADGHQRRSSGLSLAELHGQQRLGTDAAVSPPQHLPPAKQDAPPARKEAPAQPTETVQTGSDNTNKSFLQQLRTGQLSHTQMLGAVLIGLVVVGFIASSIKRMKSGHAGGGLTPPIQHTEKQGTQIQAGTVLVCCSKDKPAKVFKDATAEEVVGQVEFGTKVRVTAEPIERGGQFMADVEEKDGVPQGSIQLDMFVPQEAANIKTGTLLTCNRPEGVKVFRAASSNAVVGEIEYGGSIIASKPIEWVHGWPMIPLRPRGAVELEFFTVEDTVYGEDLKAEDKEGLAAWVKGQMEDDVETDEKLKVLKGEKTKLVMEQAMRKQKLENVMRQMLEHQAELDGKLKPSAEEVAAEAEKIMRDMDMNVAKSALRGVAYAAPLMTQSAKIYEAIDNTRNMINQKGAELVVEESKKALLDLQCVVGLEDMQSINRDVLDSVSIPSVSCLLASAFAPGQLKFLFGINSALMSLSIVFMTIDFITLFFDQGKSCLNNPTPIPRDAAFSVKAQLWLQNTDSNHIEMWFLVDFIVHFLVVLVRLPVVTRLRETIKHIQRPPESIAQAGPVKAIMMLYDFYMTTGTNALVELDAAMGSYALFLANWSMFFDICWLICGTDLSWNTPWAGCEVLGVQVLRFRVTLFQMLFLFYLLQLVFFLVGQVATGDGFSIACINVAYQLDKGIFVGMPVFTCVVHALLARGESDMVSIQLHMQKLERDRMKTEKEEAEQRLKELTATFDQKEEEIQKLEQEFEADGGRFKGVKNLKEEYEQMQERTKDKSTLFTKQIGERSVQASAQAEKTLKEWEEGEGGELIQAIGRGEGWEKAKTMAAEVDTQEILDKMKKLASEHVDLDAAQKQIEQAQAQAQAAANDINLDEMTEAAKANAAQASAAAAAASASVSQPPTPAAAPKHFM